MQAKIVYKICSQAAWGEAVARGVFKGSVADLADGFIHLSTGAQSPETARRHFAGQHNLVIVAFDAARLGPALWWEPSHGGELFPHFYGLLNAADALWHRALPLGADGLPIMPPEVV